MQYQKQAEFKRIFKELLLNHLKLVSHTDHAQNELNARLLNYTLCTMSDHNEVLQLDKAPVGWLKEVDPVIGKTYHEILSAEYDERVQNRPQDIKQLWLSGEIWHQQVLHDDRALRGDGVNEKAVKQGNRNAETNCIYSGLNVKYFTQGILETNMRHTGKSYMHLKPCNDTEPVGVWEGSGSNRKTVDVAAKLNGKFTREPDYPNGRISGCCEGIPQQLQANKQQWKKFLKEKNDVAKERQVYNTSMELLKNLEVNGGKDGSSTIAALKKIRRPDGSTLADFSEDYVRAGQLKARHAVRIKRGAQNDKAVVETPAEARYGGMIHVYPRFYNSDFVVRKGFNGAQIFANPGTYKVGNGIKSTEKMLLTEHKNDAPDRHMNLAQFMSERCMLEVPHRHTHAYYKWGGSTQLTISGIDNYGDDKPKDREVRAESFKPWSEHAYHFVWQKYGPWIVNIAADKATRGPYKDMAAATIAPKLVSNYEFSPGGHQRWRFGVYLGMRVVEIVVKKGRGTPKPLYFVCHNLKDLYHDVEYGLHRVPQWTKQHDGTLRTHYMPEFYEENLNLVTRYWAYQRGPLEFKGLEVQAAAEPYRRAELQDGAESRREAADLITVSPDMLQDDDPQGVQASRDMLPIAGDDQEPVRWANSDQTPLTFSDLWERSQVRIKREWVKVMPNKTFEDNVKKQSNRWLASNEMLHQFIMRDFPNLKEMKKGRVTYKYIPVDVEYVAPRLSQKGKLLLGVTSDKPQYLCAERSQSCRTYAKSIESALQKGHLERYDPSKSMSLAAIDKEPSAERRLAWLTCVKIVLGIFMLMNAGEPVETRGTQKQTCRLKQRIALKTIPAKEKNRIKQTWTPTAMKVVSRWFDASEPKFSEDDAKYCTEEQLSLFRKGKLKAIPDFKYLPTLTMTVWEYLTMFYNLHFNYLPKQRINSVYDSGEAKHCACARCARPFYEEPFYFTKYSPRGAGATQTQSATHTLTDDETARFTNAIDEQYIDWLTGTIVMSDPDDDSKKLHTPRAVGNRRIEAVTQPMYELVSGNYHRLTINRPAWRQINAQGNVDMIFYANRNFFSPLQRHNIKEDETAYGMGWMVELNDCRKAVQLRRYNKSLDTNLCSECASSLSNNKEQQLARSEGQVSANVRKTKSYLMEFDEDHNTAKQTKVVADVQLDTTEMRKNLPERKTAPNYDTYEHMWPYASLRQPQTFWTKKLNETVRPPPNDVNDSPDDYVVKYNKHYAYTAWRPGYDTVHANLAAHGRDDTDVPIVPGDELTGRYWLPTFFRDYLRGVLYEVQIDQIVPDNPIMEALQALKKVSEDTRQREKYYANRPMRSADTDRLMLQRIADDDNAAELNRAYKKVRQVAKRMFLNDLANYENRQRQNCSTVTASKVTRTEVWVGDVQKPNPVLAKQQDREDARKKLDQLDQLMQGTLDFSALEEQCDTTDLPTGWTKTTCMLARMGVLSYLEAYKKTLIDRLGREQVLYAQGYDPSVQRKEVIGAVRQNTRSKWYFYRDIFDAQAVNLAGKHPRFVKMTKDDKFQHMDGTQFDKPSYVTSGQDKKILLRVWDMEDDWLATYLDTGELPLKGRLSDKADDGSSTAVFGDRLRGTLVYAIRDSKLRQSRVFITYVLHRRATDDDHSLHICSRMANAVRTLFSDDNEVARLIRWGYKIVRSVGEKGTSFSLTVANKTKSEFDYPQSYIHDEYDTHIKEVDVECGVEIGPQQRLHHFHCMCTITHWSKIQMDYFAMAAWLQDAFKGTTHLDPETGEGRFYLKDQNGLPYYRDSEFPYIQVKLYPEDNYMDILSEYIKKTVPHVTFTDLKRLVSEQTRAGQQALSEVVFDST